MCLLICGIGAHASVAAAFDSNEHCSISNLSAEIAFDYVEHNAQQQPKIVDEVKTIDLELASEHLNELKRERPNVLGRSLASTSDQLADSNRYCFPRSWSRRTKGIPFSYGKIVALVDYTINPADLFSSSGLLVEPPREPAQLNSRYFVPESTISSELDVSSHNNSDHFQGDVALLFDHWHNNALNEARSEGGSLFRALANEAIADHFLEDSFAPGHLLTPRRGLSDAVALSWHDAFNARGRMLAVRNWSSLLGIYDFLNGKSDTYDCSFQRVGDKEVKKCGTVGVLSAALARLIDVDADGTCREAFKGVARVREFLVDPDGAKFDDILKIDVPLLMRTQELEDGQPTPLVCSHGDGSLDKHNKRVAPFIDAQKAVMVLIEARYIADVLETFIAAQNRTDPQGYTWCPMMHSVGFFTAGASRPGGASGSCFDLLRAAQSLCIEEHPKDAADRCRQVHVIPTYISRYVAYESRPTPNDKLSGGTFDYRDFLYSLHGGAISGNQRVVGVGGVEVGFGLIEEDSWIPTSDGFKTECRFRWLIPSCRFESVISVGFEYNMGNTRVVSNAYTLRAAFEVPTLGFQYGPYTRLVDVGNGQTRRYRTGGGLRADLGFSLLSFYLAAGVEPRLYEPIRTARGFSIETGVSFTANGRQMWDHVRHVF